MKISKTFSILLVSLVLVLNACSTQKVTIRALEPAEISAAAALQRIAVMDFKGDRVGLAGKIETTLSKRIFNGKPFFTLVNRSNIDSVLKEQKMSDLLDESTTVELGKLVGAEALITGDVSNAGMDSQHYTESRTRCGRYKKGVCTYWVSYQVNCTRQVVNLSANVRIINIEKSNVIYTNSFSEELKSGGCGGGRQFIGRASGLDKLSKRIANDFVRKMTPNYINFEVVLLDSPNIKYNSKQDKLLSSSLKFIEANNLKKAKNLLEQLHQSTGGKSMVASYNLGTMHEALGNYNEAKIYYDIADNLQKKPIEAIAQATSRIVQLLKKQKQTQQQLKK